jgi:hypothetical protein
MSNVLTVRLFLVSIAVATFALGVNQAGWRHKTLIGSLFTIAAVCVAAAIFFPDINTAWPHFTSSLGNIASDARVWFGLVVFLALYVLIWPIRVKPEPRQQHSSAVTGTRPIAPALTPALTPALSSDLGPLELMALCEGRTDVEIQEIVRGRVGELLELSGIVYNVRSNIDDSATISIDLDPKRAELILARVSDKDRATRALNLRTGDKLKCSGKISDISKTMINLVERDFSRL